jgi:hypothetical protein
MSNSKVTFADKTQADVLALNGRKGIWTDRAGNHIPAEIHLTQLNDEYRTPWGHYFGPVVIIRELEVSKRARGHSFRKQKQLVTYYYPNTTADTILSQISKSFTLF